MWWWWWAWVWFVILLLILPWAYGWRRRGWGPPYPTYYRRRTYTRRAPIAPEPPDTDPYAPVPPMHDRDPAAHEAPTPGRYPGQGWSWLADLLWLGVLAAIGWAIYLWVT